MEHFVRFKVVLLCRWKIGAYSPTDILVSCQIIFFGIEYACIPVKYHLPFIILLMQIPCYRYAVCVHILPPVFNRQCTYSVHTVYYITLMYKSQAFTVIFQVSKVKCLIILFYNVIDVLLFIREPLKTGLKRENG